MHASIYCADVYCADCTSEILAQCRTDGSAAELESRGADLEDEHTYDSDEYPKYYDPETEESDSPQHCGDCGVFLQNPLTSDGDDYVRAAVVEAAEREVLTGPVAEWREYYDYIDYDDVSDESRAVLSACELVDDGNYEILWHDPRILDCDHPVGLFVRLEYTREWGDSPSAPFHCSIVAVSPGFAEPELDSVCSALDIERKEFRAAPFVSQCQELISHGTYATLHQSMGWSAEKLLTAAREELNALQFMIGFRLDSAQNAIGATGWDFLTGDITRALRG